MEIVVQIVKRLIRQSRKFLSILVAPALKIYHRRRSQYTHTGEIALCCIAKMENEYIRFFVEYYKNLHFDKIFIYDNNDPDGERFEETISDYIDSGFVEIIDYRGRQIAQLAAYQDCYDRYNKYYDWIAVFDCDEFLTFADGTEDIHAFLNQKKFLPYQVVHVNWKIYGDNDLLDSDGRNVIERFKDPIFPLDFKTREYRWNDHVKSIVRGGLTAIVWNSPHTPSSSYHACCNSEGVHVEINSRFQPMEFNTVCLRHYRTKTIGEWIRIRMIRGQGDMSDNDWRQIMTINHFFEYNSITCEKIKYAEKLLHGEK